MKKAITTILSALLLISCLTVNVFAEGDEQNAQEETTIQENIVTDQVDTDNANQTNESVTSQESNDGNASRQTATNASVTVDNMTVNLNQHVSGFWDFDFKEENAFNVYQAIAFEKKHFIVSYNGKEIHGNCSESGFKKFDAKIKNGWYSYVLENDTDGLSFDLRIDPGVDAKIGEFTPSVTIGDIDYGFSREGESKLFVFNPGENYQPPENFDFGSCKIDIASGESIRSYDTKGNGVYQNSYVDLYIILWHKTDNGFDNICLALSSGNGPQQGPNRNIKEAQLLFNNSALPLFAMNMNNNNILWAIDFGPIDENSRRAYFDYINTENPVFQIKYKTEESEYYLQNNSFSIGLIDVFNIYGKHTFINVDGQNNYFVLQPNFPVIDMNTVTSISVTMNNETRTVNIANPEVIDGLTYYKVINPFTFTPESMFDVTITSGGQQFTYESIGDYHRNESGVNKIEEQSATFYDKKSNSYIVICSNYVVTDKLASSYIKPINNSINFGCENHNNGSEYIWNFIVSPEQFYSNEKFKLSFGNNTSNSIQFSQTQDSINQVGQIAIENSNDGFNVYAPLKNESRFEAKNGDSVQKHIIRFDCDYYEVKRKTSIENLNFNNGNWFNIYDSTYNNSKQMFDLITVGAQLDSNSFKSLVSEIQQGSNIQLDKYYTMTLKEGYSIVGSPVYEVVNSNRGKIVKVKYSVKNGSNNSQIVINIESNFNQGDMSQIFVGNKEFHLEDAIEGTRVYISSTNGPNLVFDANEVVAAVNDYSEKHNAIFVDYDFKYFNNHNSNQYPKEVSDGYEVDPNCSISLKLYYLDNLDILNGGSIEYAALTEATSFKNAINTRFPISQFDNYPGAGEHRLKTELKIPYKVNGGSLLTPSSTKETPDQNTGVSVWVNYSVNNETNQIEFYRNMSFMKPASIVHYFIAGSDDGHFEYDRVIYVGGNNNEEYPASAYGLEKAINDLRNAGRSSVVLMDDVTLERNVYLKHNSYEHVEDPYSPLQDIEINLNGHNINTGNYSLVNLRTSTLHITNYQIDQNGKSTGIFNTRAQISSGSTNPTIINYGGLYLLNNIKVVNNQGTGIETYNSGNLFLTKDTVVDANICIDIIENEVFSDGRSNSRYIFSGNLIADYIAIRSTTVESDVVNFITIYSEMINNVVGKAPINSGDVGIKTIGNAKIEIFGSEITAKKPIEMSGGTIEIRYADIKSTDGSPVITVNSSETNATNSTILIASETNVCMSTSGTLIKEVSAGESKINSIYFYSINPKDESYFDYASGKLFEFDSTPSANSILINGGCFSDQSYKNYLQGAFIDEKTATHNNKTYYFNLKKNNVAVSTFQDLKTALENPTVDSVRLSSNISATADSIITFAVNTPKVLFINGFTIENVKFEPVTTIQGAPKAFFTIDNEGKSTGKIINDGVVIESNVDELNIRDIDIESTNNVAIKINCGKVFAISFNENKTVQGLKAIEVNSGDNNLVDDISFDRYNLTGTAGPAIDVIKTNKFVYFNLQKCNIKTLLNNDSSDSSAIRINDTTRLSAQSYSVIEGTKYGVYFTDSLPGDGFVNTYAGLQLSRNTKVSADIAFRLGNFTTVHLDNIFVEAETSILELHGFTQYVITAGEYKLTKGEDIITFVGVDPNNDYHWHRITGGYYSYELPDNEIFNDPNSDYFYDCLPVSLSNNPLPWLVARSIKGQNNFQYIEVPAGRDVTVDGDKLDNAYDKEETSGYDSFDIVLTVKYKNDSSVKEKFDGHGNGFKEYYDIHVDKIVDNVAVDNVDSTKNYQHITIPLNEVNLEDQNIIYEKIDNVKVYHKHGNSNPVSLKKIDKNKAINAKEECYYLEEINGTWYLNIITRQFSDFAIAEDDNVVATSDLKTDYSLNLQYKDLYYLGDISIPKYAVYGDNKKISVQDVDTVYYSLDENDYYYGKDMPNKPGTYMAEWTVKEGKEITGSGKKQFVIKPAYLSSIKMKDNLVYSGEPIKLIENISNISDYSFKLVDSKNESKIFDGIIPVAVNAGTYQLWYLKNDVTEFIGNVIINKATIMLNKPRVLTATYGDILSDINLPTGWSWKDKKQSVGNATTTGNKFEAIFTPADTNNYKVVSIELPVVVNKAETDIKTITIPTFTGVEKGTLLSDLKFKESGWNWVNPKDTVSDSNHAIYNPDRNNYNDLLVSIPVYIKETVAGKEVSISNTVSSNDEKGIEEVTVANDAISNSVVDVVAKAEESETKVSKEVTDFINNSVSNSLTITTELVKKTVNDESKKQEAIEQANVKTGEVAMVLDLEIKIKVDNGTESKEGKVTELSEPVKLTFKLPEGSKVTASEGKELKYYVLIIHEGEVHKVPAVLNADGTVTFEADKFSTYILVSEEIDKPAENNKPSYVPSQDKKPVVNTSAK